MKIAVDFDICESNAVCMQYAPALFEVGDDDLLDVVQEDVPEDQAAAAQEAARRCPRQAITLTS